MSLVLALAVLVAVVWLVLRAPGSGSPRDGSGGGADPDDLLDDMVLHDEVNPGDEGDVGDTTDGR